MQLYSQQMLRMQAVYLKRLLEADIGQSAILKGVVQVLKSQDATEDLKRNPLPYKSLPLTLSYTARCSINITYSYIHRSTQ